MKHKVITAVAGCISYQTGITNVQMELQQGIERDYGWFCENIMEQQNRF